MNRILALGLCLLLAACSSNDTVELEPAELVKFKETVEVKRLWSQSIGSGAGSHYTLLPTAIAGDDIFAVDTEGLLMAVNRLNGKKRWRIELEERVASGVGAAQGKLFVGTLNGELVALSASDGSELWRTRLSSEVLAPPQSNGSVVVVQTQDGRIVGLDTGSGRQLWMQEVAVPALTLRGTSTPIVTDTAVYAGFASGKIMALDVKDGLVQWEQRVALATGRSELERVVDINAAPLLEGDILYCGSYQGRLVALNRGTGAGLWAKKESSFNNLAAGNQQIYLTDENAIVKAYNANSGTLVWENDQLIRRQVGAPQTFGNYVAVADFEGYVHIMNQSDGTFVARRKVDGDGVRSPMQGVDNILYVYGNSGDLVALRAE
ncbi:MAG: outer membrane protein assembly factor BamB [Gammaproteobacteria bacterium]|uniref:outer membrane protein assembly factor BamB n=1 Tax=Pseudomaricurvus alcaniphilus TaxID=1166482 RepID=UPI001408B69F|nr:outer membrane protein assembly factor BamB [Pseudomaricurvus alcaniphilus]MBR9911208.1 outer membrane protein assembly factor BamB [Gammaproteobacteria bacterium]NHN37587.1 outer membrane protein assembly factor BamB [Pseudomaricurvus alcaniphilus]